LSIFPHFLITVIKRHDRRSILAIQNLPNFMQMQIHRVYAKRLIVLVYSIVVMYWRLATMFLHCRWNTICATTEHNQLAWRWM